MHGYKTLCIIYLCLLIQFGNLKMDSTEYDELCNYLLRQKYLEHLGNCKNLKRNFRRKALKFRVDEKNALYQVSFNNFQYKQIIQIQNTIIL